MQHADLQALGLEQQTAHIRACANAIRDIEYEPFIKLQLPNVLKLLQAVPPAMDAAAQEHKLRNAIIDLLHKLPMTEALAPSVPDIFNQVLRTISIDNEVNASKCLNVLLTLFKSFKQESTPYVQSFVDLFKSLYGNFRNTAFALFSGWSQVRCKHNYFVIDLSALRRNKALPHR
jgi:hypothetical protein